MADITAARLVVPVSTNAGVATAQLRTLDGQINTTTARTKKLSTTMAGLSRIGIAAFTAVAASGIVRMGAAMVRAASAAEETQQKFNVVFRDIQERANQTATTLARDYALSGEESQRLLSNTADLVTGFGATQEQALELSEAVQRLAADQASFNNLAGGTVQASEAITAALLGERERVKALGVTISEAAVNQEIMARGQSALTGEARLLARAQATLTLITRQSGNAIGDFARSSESSANVMRALQANMADAGVAIGRDLLPGLTELGRAMRDGTKDGGALLGIFRGIARLAGEAARQVSTLVKQLNAVAAFDARALARAQAESLPEGERRDALLAALNRGQTTPPPGTTPPGATPPGSTTGGQQQRAAAARSLAIERSGFEEKNRLNEEHLENYKNMLRQKDQAERDSAEQRVKTAKDAFQAILGATQQITSGISDIFAMAANNEIQSAENAFTRRKAMIEANVSDETERAKLIAQAEAEKDNKVGQIERKAAARQKKIAIFETIITTAQAAMSAFSALAGIPIVGPALGAAAAAAVTAVGVAKVALISAQPLPAAQFGGNFVVPPGNEADSGLLNVNQGERVSVEPVRHSGGNENKTMIVKIGEQEFRAYFQEEVNNAMNSGNVQIQRTRAVKRV